MADVTRLPVIPETEVHGIHADLLGSHPLEAADIQPYGLFFFCGILPWTWFSSSLSESSNVLISGGNLIKKVLFPAEVLPIVSVLANLVHFLLGLPILAVLLVYYQRPLDPLELLWFPVIVLVQFLFTTGIALLHASFGCQRAGALPRNADRPTGGLRRWGDREIPSENRSVRG